MPKQTKLSPKHWKALELISSGMTNMSEVAKLVGIDPGNFHSLMHGDVEKMGNAALVFQQEYGKIVDKKLKEGDKKISRLLQASQQVSLEVLEREINFYKSKPKLKIEEQKVLTYLIKAVAALKPDTPRIGKLSQSWTYTKGLSAEELVHEFSRLKGLTKATPDGGRIPSDEQGSAGDGPASSERGSEAEEVEEDSGIYSDAEAGDIPQGY